MDYIYEENKKGSPFIITELKPIQLPNMDMRVEAKVHEAIARLERMGAMVGTASVAEHGLAGALWQSIGCEGLMMQMMHNGMGFNWNGQYDIALLDKQIGWADSAHSNR